ncbi:MAG: fibronectin type III domain-containing protein [Bacteriovoracia bacterium]
MFSTSTLYKGSARWLTFFLAFSVLTACDPQEAEKPSDSCKDKKTSKDSKGKKDDACEAGNDGGGTTPPPVNPKPYPFPTLPNRVCTIDKFKQDQTTGGGVKKLDVLFVMDHSGSMADDWERVANNIQEMVRELPADLDIRYSVLLSDVGTQKGRLYAPVGYKVVLDNQKMRVQEISSALHKTFVEGMKVSDPTGEAAFYSLYKAVTANAVDNQRLGFFRADAALSVIFASDEQEAGFPFPNPQAPGLPKRCDTDYEENIKKTYYDKQGVNLEVAFNAVKKLKGDMPVVTHAFVNITKEDLFKRNSKNASCLYDSLGYGYFEMVAKTQGVLFSLQANRAEGMARCGQVTRERLQLVHDFKLSKPAEKVDPATIISAVDGKLAQYTYAAASNMVHIDEAGVGGSIIEIRHCEPDGRKDWTLVDFAGTAAQYSVNLAWKTPEYATDGKVLWGLSATALNNTTPVAAKDTNHTISVASLTPNTVYYFQAVSKDEFGQSKSSSVISVRTLPDWTITGVSGQPSRNTATVKWRTAEYPTKGKVRWGLDSAALVNESAQTAVLNDHTVAITNLQANTDYYYQVVSSDEYGLEKTSAVASMRTVTDWGLIGFGGTAARTSAALTWQTPEYATSGKVMWGTSVNNLVNQAVDGVVGTSHGVSVTGLTANTTYYFQAVGTDDLGSVKRSEVIALRTVTDWSLTGFSGTSTIDSVHVAWQTAEYATSGKVLWGLSADALTNAQGDGVTGTSHGVDINGLNEDTIYYFQAVSRDNYALEKQSAVIAIRTAKKPVDPTPLPVWDISDFSGFATTTSVTINWRTDGYATSGAVLWGTASGALHNEVPETGAGFAHSVNVSGLTPDTLYYFKVVARDDQGQEKQSVEIPVRTMAVVTPDPDPTPTWSVSAFDGTTTPNSATLIWQTPGALTKATVKVGTSPTSLNLQAVSVDTFAETQLMSVTGLSPNTAYYFQVIAVDKNGHTVESVVLMKRTKAQ